MRLFYTDHFELPLTPDHKFPMSKYRLLRERLATAGWAIRCEFTLHNAASKEPFFSFTEPDKTHFNATIYAIQLSWLGASAVRTHSPLSSPSSSSCSQYT